MKLFGKLFKSDVPPDVGEEEGEKEEVQEVEEKEEAPQASSSSADMARITVDITRMKAQIEAVKELRKMTSERFSLISEQIGELRSNLIEKEKDIRDTQLKAVKAYDLVEQVQPDQFNIEIQKANNKIQGLVERIEGYKSLSESALEELKEVRRKISSFRGLENVVKLSEDVKKELVNIQRVKVDVEKHSDKVEQVFVNFQKNLPNVQRMGTDLSNTKERMNSFEKAMNQSRITLQTFASKDEIGGLGSRLDGLNEKISKLLLEIDNNKQSIKNVSGVKAKLLESVYANSKKIQGLKVDMDKIRKNLDSSLDYFEQLSSKLDGKVPQNDIVVLTNSMKQMEDKVNGLLEVLEILEQKIGMGPSIEKPLKVVEKIISEPEIEVPSHLEPVVEPEIEVSEPSTKDVSKLRLQVKKNMMELEKLKSSLRGADRLKAAELRLRIENAEVKVKKSIKAVVKAKKG